MWVTGDVDIPEALIDAHSRGQLVIFVGAGASVDSPSSLPLFDALARQIAGLAAHEYDDTNGPDAFLSDLGACDVEVHRLAHELIGKVGSLPNATHRAIAKLAKASPRIRVVTTNYDEHLGTAFTELGGPKLQKYVAPALPLGRKFEGLVHLHGSIERPPEELVMTDVDFGQAYLTDVWASRFLEPMFAAFSVLFVGYSHDDTVMKYLAKGLTRSRQRYALTCEEGDEKWRPLSIVPIHYPVRDDSHSALPEALDEWASRSVMGAFDHRSRLRDIVSAPPPQTPVEADYVKELIGTAYGARFFAECQSGDEWLGFVEAHPSFALNFRAGEITEPSRVLGQWFASWYVANPDRQALALGLVERAGVGLHPEFLAAIVGGVTTLVDQPEHFNRWVSALAEHIARAVDAQDHVEMLLASCTLPSNRTALALLLRIGLTPRARLRPALAWFTSETDDAPSLPTAELAWTISHRVLETVWIEVLSPRLPSLAEMVIEIFGQAVTHAYEVLTGYRGALDAFDSLSAGRSAIEDHEQDTFFKVEGVLIDGLRDASITLAEREEATTLLDRWWRSGWPVFRRLAVHAWSASGDLSSDDKIRFVLDHNLLYENDTKHEVFTLLAHALGDSSKPVRDELLARVAADLPPDYEHEYPLYNLLVWLTEHGDGWAEAREALEEVQQRNPQWERQEYPDLDSYSISGSNREVFPITVDRFIEDARNDPSATLSRLTSMQYAESTFDGPTWEDAMVLISQSLAEAPALASPIWCASDGPEAEGRRGDIRSAIMRGLARAEIPEPEWEPVLALIDVTEVDQTIARYVADLLLSGAKESNGGIPSWLLEQAEAVALKMWKVHEKEFAHPPTGNYFSLAINSWPGKIAEFWIRRVSKEWTEVGPAAWKGITGAARTALVEMTGSGLPAQGMTHPIVASQLYFLFTADEDFTMEYVLPLFDSNASGGTAEHAWDAYLGQPRVNERLLEKGFAELLMQSHLASNLSDDARTRYFHLLATVFSRSNIANQFMRKYLDELINDGTGIVDFYSQVTEVLRPGTADETAEVWDRWLQTYVERRIGGLPRQPSPAELIALAAWAPYAGGRFPQIVKVLTQRPFGFGTQSVFLKELVSLDVAATYPHDVFQFVTHLLQNTETGVRIPSTLGGVVGEIARCAPDLAVNELVDLAVRKGAPNAESWIAAGSR